MVVGERLAIQGVGEIPGSASIEISGRERTAGGVVVGERLAMVEGVGGVPGLLNPQQAVDVVAPVERSPISA